MQVRTLSTMSSYILVLYRVKTGVTAWACMVLKYILTKEPMIYKNVDADTQAKRDHDKAQKAAASARLKKNAEYNRAHGK